MRAEWFLASISAGLALGLVAYGVCAALHAVPTYGEPGAGLTLAAFLLGGVVLVTLWESIR